MKARSHSEDIQFNSNNSSSNTNTNTNNNASTKPFHSTLNYNSPTFYATSPSSVDTLAYHSNSNNNTAASRYTSPTASSSQQHHQQQYNMYNQQAQQQYSSQQQPLSLQPNYHNDQYALTTATVNDITHIRMPSFEARYYLNERVNHLHVMFNYRTRMCDNIMSGGTCVYDNSQCFDAHSYDQLRRVPRILAYSNGHFYSYNACRCQQYDNEGTCDKGTECRYSHCKDEIGIHPSRYKTQPCSFETNAQGQCVKFGPHCALYVVYQIYIVIYCCTQNIY